MKSQTARRPAEQRATRSANPNKFTRQTARVEARRDGKPLIFGWGGHLSRNEKTIIQRRAVWTLTILITVAIIAVLIAFWVNINITVPNKPITSVNGQTIPQSDYHKLVVFKAQLASNTLQGPHGLIAQRDALTKTLTALQKRYTDTGKQYTDLNKKIKALPAGPSAQRTDLEGQLHTAQATLKDIQTQGTALSAQYQTLTQNTIPNEQGLYVQSQIGNESVQWLQEDLLIRGWLAKGGSDLQAKINPSDAAIARAINDFSAQMPRSNNYNQFLSKYGVSDSDMHAMMALKLRRDNMQTYLASQITSPARQVQARAMTLSTTKDANAILNQLNGGADFATLAKQKSVDNATKSKGGDLGWLVQGQYIKDYGSNLNGGTIDNWLFDLSRKAKDLSPVLTDNGTYHIVQLEAIDQSRAVDKTVLSSLKDNALIAWMLDQKALPGTKITPADQNMLLDPLNMPQNIPTAPPNQQQGQPGQPQQGLPAPAGSSAGGAAQP